MINGLCFFEIPADNVDELKVFYGEMFGWTFEKGSPGFRHYHMLTPGGGPKGGLSARQDPQHGPVNYIKVASAQEAITRAQALGAKVLVDKKPVPGAGWYAVLLDPQGNRLGLWEDDPQAL